MPRFKARVLIIASEEWTTIQEADRVEEVEDYVREQGVRNFMPDNYSVDILDITEVSE